MKIPQSSRRALFSYVIGFVLSLTLTITAYLLVQHHLDTHHRFPPDSAMVVILLILAIAQLLVQLNFFLHLNREDEPRWKLIVLIFAAIVLFILVAGSLWIMHSLNYRMETPQQINKYLQSQGDL